MELQENLVTAQDENSQLQSALDQSVQDYSPTGTARLGGGERGGAPGGADTMMESRDSLVSALDEAGEFADELMAVIDSMNETMVTFYDAWWRTHARSTVADRGPERGC